MQDGCRFDVYRISHFFLQRTVSDLKTYFSIYGEVKSVHIVKKNKGTTRDGVVFQYGFVTFAKAESAAK